MWGLWLVDWSSECSQSQENVHPWLKDPKELRLCRVSCVMSESLELTMAHPEYIGPLFSYTLTNYRMLTLLWNLINAVATTLWILSLTQLAPILVQCKPSPAGLRNPTLLPMKASWNTSPEPFLPKALWAFHTGTYSELWLHFFFFFTSFSMFLNLMPDPLSPDT